MYGLNYSIDIISEGIRWNQCGFPISNLFYLVGTGSVGDVEIYPAVVREKITL